MTERILLERQFAAPRGVIHVRPLDFSAPDLGQRAVIDAGRDGPGFSVLVEAARQ